MHPCGFQHTWPSLSGQIDGKKVLLCQEKNIERGGLYPGGQCSIVDPRFKSLGQHRDYRLCNLYKLLDLGPRVWSSHI